MQSQNVSTLSCGCLVRDYSEIVVYCNSAKRLRSGIGRLCTFNYFPERDDDTRSQACL